MSCRLELFDHVGDAHQRPPERVEGRPRLLPGRRHTGPSFALAHRRRDPSRLAVLLDRSTVAPDRQELADGVEERTPGRQSGAGAFKGAHSLGLDDDVGVGRKHFAQDAAAPGRGGGRTGCPVELFVEVKPRGLEAGASVVAASR